MPKKRWFVLPCGAMYGFLEYNYEDLSTTVYDYMLENISREKLKTFCNPDNVGRKPKMWIGRIYAKLMRRMWQLVMEEMMQGNRVILSTRKDIPTIIYIGRQPPPIQRKVRTVNWDTKGKTYGIILEGVPHNYYFRLRSVRNKEIRQKISEGQMFH